MPSEQKTEHPLAASESVDSAMQNDIAQDHMLARERLARLDGYIRFEFELTAQRVTYLATSESFLFTAYALALSNSDKEKVLPLLQPLVNFLPVVGLLLALPVLLAVICAISMIIKLKYRRMDIEKHEANLDIHPDVNLKSIEHWVGLLPPLVIPTAFIFAWLKVWQNPPVGKTILVAAIVAMVFLCVSGILLLKIYRDKKGK